MRSPRIPRSRGSRGDNESKSAMEFADEETPAPGPGRGDGISAAIALLTATVPTSDSSAQSREEALEAVIPNDCVDLIDLFAGLYAVAHILLLELSAASGEPLAEPLQRLAVATLADRRDS